MIDRSGTAACMVLGMVCALFASPAAAAVPLGGFIPFAGIGLTNQFQTFDSDPSGAFFVADPSTSWGGTPLGPGAAYFDLALLDTGAATHILSQAAAGNSAFNIDGPYSGQSDGFRGTNLQTIFGAAGSIELRITDPLGVYAAGLADRTSAGPALSMNTAAMRGQTSTAILEATDATWTLPNVLGLPMAAHHAISIRNDEPQIFEYQGRTVRTPNIDFIARGSGPSMGILRRADLRLRPSAGFIQGPLYVQNFDLLSGDFHENPLSPSVIENGALFIEVDLQNGSRSFQDKELLFDTGADLTVLSQVTAARLGFDALVDEPDFFLEVEGAGGVEGGVPGFYLDELNIDTVGGSFTLHNVPVAVLNLPNPNDPANVVDGIIGMNLFTGRNLVIDANPAASAEGGGPPALYISNPVYETHNWSSLAQNGTWATPGNWSAAGTPNVMWAVNVANTAGTNQTAVVAASSTVYQATVSGTTTAEMTVQIESGATLTTYGETVIGAGGRIELRGGNLDTQFVNIEGGVLAGEGVVFAGTGPIHSPVRNLSGRIEPGDPIGQLTIDGDLSQQADGTIAIDLAGTTPITQYDRLAVDRFAFLSGTLEVNLVGFTPAVGSTFTVLTAEDIVGEFDTLALPAGFQWNLTYSDSDVVLTVAALGLAGDFNQNGAVDAADYIVWRNGLGATYTQADYNVWRANFGKTLGTSSSAADISSSTVPEPACGALIAIGAVLGLASRLIRPARS